MTEELLLEINRDFLRHFQGARNDDFPPELAKLEIGGISEQVYSVLRKIFSEYEGTYSKRIETFLGDKNSSCLSGINTYPFGEPTNDIYRDFFGICAERSNLDLVLDEALRYCELVLNHYEAEDHKAVIILTNKWNDYKFHKKYFSEFLRYALIENVIFVFLLYSDYAVTLIPFLPLNRYDFWLFRGNGGQKMPSTPVFMLIMHLLVFCWEVEPLNPSIPDRPYRACFGCCENHMPCGQSV